MNRDDNIPVPFKVMSSFPVGLAYGYEILLVDLKGFTTNTKLKWYKEAIMKLILQTDYEERTSKKVVLVKKLHPYFFLPGDLSSIIYESKNALTLPRFIEFSYASLNNPKFCKRGFVMLTSLNKCPLMTNCPYYRPKGLSCKYLYHYKEVKYSELFEIESSIKVRGDYDIVKTLLCLFYKGTPLVKVSEVCIHTPLIYVDKVIVKNRLCPTAAYFVLEPKYKVGWTIKITKGLLFTYYKEALQNIVEKLMSDNKARKMLEYNYYLSKRQTQAPIYSSITHMIIGDLKEFSRYSSLQKYQNMTLGSDFIKYCERVIVHLVTHLFINYMCRKASMSMEKVYHSIRTTDNTIEAIVISNNPLIHRVIELLRKKPIQVLIELVNQACEFTRGDNFKEQNLKIRENEKDSLRIVETIISFVNTIGYLPHPLILWTYIGLSEENEMNENRINKLISLLANLLATRGYSLVRIKNCEYDPISQWTFLNPTLLSPLLNELRLALIDSDITLLRDSKLSNIYLINSILSLANKQLYIITGYLSSITIEKIIKPHIQKGINVSILAGTVFKSKKYKAIVESIRRKVRIESLLKRLPRYTLIVIDDVIALIGYWNLTNNSLRLVKAYTFILYNPQKVKTLIHYLNNQTLK